MDQTEGFQQVFNIGGAVTKKKKTITIVAIIVVALGAYALYFSKDTPFTLDSVISYDNVSYVVDKDYSIKSRHEEITADTVKFDDIVAEFNGNRLQGDHGILYRNRGNYLVVNGGVKGSSSSGWNFKTEEVDYTPSSGLITSNTRTEFDNVKDKTRLTGNNFISDKGFQNIVLKGNCVLIDGNYTIKSDSLEYDKLTHTIIAIGNVSVKGKNIVFGKQTFKEVDFTSSQAKMDSLSKDLTISSKFQATSNGMVLTGDTFTYSSASRIANVIGSGHITFQKSEIDADKIEFDGEKKVITFTGNVHGNAENSTFVADALTIDQVQNSATGINDTITYQNTTHITASKSISNLTTHENQFFGDTSSKVVVKNSKGTLTTDELEFNSQNATVTIPNNYTFVTQFNNETYTGSGRVLNYSERVGSGTTLNFMAKSLTTLIQGDTIAFNTTTGDINLSGNAKMVKNSYTAVGNSIKTNIKTHITTFDSQFTITNSQNFSQLSGTELVYNDDTKEVTINQPFNFIKNGFNVSADNLEYTLQNGNGKMWGDINFINGDQKESGTTDAPVTISKGHLIAIPGTTLIHDGMATITTSNITYDTSVSKGVINGSGVIQDATGAYRVTFVNGTIDGVKNFVRMNTTKGDIKAASTPEITFNSAYADYYYQTDQCLFDTKVTYLVKNISLTMDSGSIDFDNNFLKGENPILSTTQGDSIVAKSMDGNLNVMEFGFYKNVVGDIVSAPSSVSGSADESSSGVSSIQKLNFSGDSGKLFMQGNSSGNFITRRLELRKQCDVKYGANSELKSDYIEFNNLIDTLFAKGNAHFTSVKGNKIAGKDDLIHITGSAESIQCNVDTNIVTLTNKVVINSNTQSIGPAKITAGKAVVYMDKNQIKLYDNAILTRGKNTIESQKALFDMNTNELSGNNGIDMSIDIPLNQ